MTNLSEFRDRANVAAHALRPADIGPTSLPTGTVTFLLTDIEGSTPRWDLDPTAMAPAVARHLEILDAAVLGHAGVRPMEQGEGDSMVAAFARASDAVAAALAAQFALTEEDWPAGAEIRVRMALHTGEAQLRDGLYYVGPSIIRCARLRALADGGQVLASHATALLLRDDLPPEAGLLPLGAHQLKGLREPERIFALTHPRLPAAATRLSGAVANLPAQLTSFVGRATELGEIAAALEEHRLVTLVGPGGCGKTRLAAEAARAAAPQQPDGVYWVDLATVADPERVPEAVLDALGVYAKATVPTVRIVEYLAGRRVLLVLDNCEHVRLGAATLAQALLTGCPDTTIAATSREPLQLGAEAVWQVQPMSLPPHPDVAPPAVLRNSEAVALFLERAATSAPALTVDEPLLRTAAAICTRLDGIPLAIELAAARLRSLVPDRVLAGLEHRFRLLAGGSPTVPARQRTLSGCIEWSYDQLDDRERVLLARLAVFVGRFSLDDALAVDASLDPAGAGEADLLLSDLVDCSLVRFDALATGCWRRSASSRSCDWKTPARRTPRAPHTYAANSTS
ncbi:MAG: ATP-binding protein [Sporichthyaceae bacterium]